MLAIFQIIVRLSSAGCGCLSDFLPISMGLIAVEMMRHASCGRTFHSIDENECMAITLDECSLAINANHSFSSHGFYHIIYKIVNHGIGIDC